MFQDSDDTIFVFLNSRTHDYMEARAFERLCGQSMVVSGRGRTYFQTRSLKVHSDTELVRLLTTHETVTGRVGITCICRAPTPFCYFRIPLCCSNPFL